MIDPKYNWPYKSLLSIVITETIKRALDAEREERRTIDNTPLGEYLKKLEEKETEETLRKLSILVGNDFVLKEGNLVWQPKYSVYGVSSNSKVGEAVRKLLDRNGRVIFVDDFVTERPAVRNKMFYEWRKRKPSYII